MVEAAQFQRIAELRDSGRLEESIREATALLGEAANDDERAALLTGMQISFVKLGRLHEARQVLERMARLDVGDQEIRMNIDFCGATQLIDEGRYEQGAAAFAAMLERHSDDWGEGRFRYLYEDIQCRRAEALVWLSRCHEAMPILREAATFTIDRAWQAQRVHYGLGACLLDKGDAEGAGGEFGCVISFDLRNDFEERALWRLAVIHWNKGALAQAKEHLERILRNFPGPNPAVPRKRVYELLARTFHYLGDKEDEKRYADLARRA